MTVWKHPEKSDWDEAQAMLDNADVVAGATVTWFEIDETTQGSLFVLPTKEDYEAALEGLQAMRQEAIENGSRLEMEAIGPVMAHKQF
jgi:hypothetical protein|tara:strand:+ start:3490 stop:3753 length:264 start_codon:yes stop_codon:yes gene_type:complete